MDYATLLNEGIPVWNNEQGQQKPSNMSRSKMKQEKKFTQNK